MCEASLAISGTKPISKPIWNGSSDKTTGNGKMIDHIAFTPGDLITFPSARKFSVDKLVAGLTVCMVAPAIVAKVVVTGAYMPNSASSFIALTGAANIHRSPHNWTAGALVGAVTEGLNWGLVVDMAPIRVSVVDLGATHTGLFQGLLIAVAQRLSRL